MNIYITYAIIFAVLLALELLYFRIADRCNIIDKPNERSSHSTIVLRGGGILFPIAALVWLAMGVIGGADVTPYLPFVIGLLLIAGVSFVDDIASLPDSVRLVAQFIAYGLMFWSLGVFALFGEYGWLMGVGAIVLALVVCVGATNIYNFMDGINGITAGYSMAVLVPLLILNGSLMKVEGTEGFVEETLLGVVALSVVVFSIFNFRPKGKAKCFAGDVGSIGIAFILLFAIGRLILQEGDITWLILLLVYGVDGCLTIVHRILLHENLGEAHRKHAYQLMANELKVGHVKVSLLYMALQLVVSLGFVFVCPPAAKALGIGLVACHWIYLAVALVVLALAYLLFMKKYYHLHEEYLQSLRERE